MALRLMLNPLHVALIPVVLEQLIGQVVISGGKAVHVRGHKPRNTIEWHVLRFFHAVLAI